MVESWLKASINGSLMTTSSVAMVPSGREMGVASRTDPVEVEEPEVEEEEGGIRESATWSL